MSGRTGSSFKLADRCTLSRDVLAVVLGAGVVWGQSGYVNPAVCAACHAEIAKTYQLTGMGRSFSRPRVEDFKTPVSYYHPASDRHYSLAERDGRLYERRQQTGYGGTETNVVEKSIDYAIGSGNHARTYLH